MAQANPVLDRADLVRKKTLAILSSLTETARAFGLPDPAPNLAQYGKKLEENTFQVLVVGEAKRGKSTFVNALIGRDILPTDVDIATSQVFRVCHAESEAYRLRFEDNSQQEISVAGLHLHGSQAAADADGMPRPDDKIIRWIEVDVPAQFLPANVSILDTPGLGALYAAHRKITYKLVPHADAVLFVLDSQAPIGEPEMQLVSRLLEVTRSILFVQTKIDQFRREAWQAIQKRNQEILAKQFGDRLADVRVWPISSINLRKAAQTGDDDYYMVSRHTELGAALKAFLFRVSGRSRSAEAILLAGHYHALSRQVLAVRLAALTEESKQNRAAFQQRAQEHRKQFEAAWGERGQQRRDLLESIQRIAAIGKQAIWKRLATQWRSREALPRPDRGADRSPEQHRVGPVRSAKSLPRKWRNRHDRGVRGTAPVPSSGGRSRSSQSLAASASNDRGQVHRRARPLCPRSGRCDASTGRDPDASCRNGGMPRLLRDNHQGLEDVGSEDVARTF